MFSPKHIWRFEKGVAFIFGVGYYIQEPLENVDLKINMHIEDIRARADAKQTDSNVGFMVNELIQTVKEWDALAQPIQLSKKSRAERHNASFEIAQRLRILAADLFGEYGKIDFARNIINALKEVFAEVPEIAEYISEDAKALEDQIPLVRGVEKFKEIKSQVEKIKEASDAKRPDSTLEPMVKQLIQTVKTWDISTQPIEANKAVASVVRALALHLWNEHEKLDFSMVLTLMLFQVFEGVPEVSQQLATDWDTLKEINEQRKSQNDTGCLLQIVIFAVTGVIVALLQAC